MEDSVITSDVPSYPVEELQTEETQLQQTADALVDSALPTVKTTPGWEFLKTWMDERVKEYGDITQMAAYDGDPQVLAGLIGQAKFVLFLKEFKALVEDAAEMTGHEG